MPQNVETGRQGYENGYGNADEIGSLLGASRVERNANIFKWNGRHIVIKSGPSAVVTLATLERVKAVVYGVRMGTVWELYEIARETFKGCSGKSKSKRHGDNYRLMSRGKIREHGKVIDLQRQ